jgi:FAD/FMN-containing dehydrogenase
VTDPYETAVFRLLDQPHSVAALRRKAAEETSEPRTEDEVRALLDGWVDDGIVFTDAGQYVHLAPSAVNQDLLRLDFMRHTHRVRPDGPAARAEEPALS